jgi:Ca2+-binding RTX toxin-like protein
LDLPSVNFSISQPQSKVTDTWGLRPPAGNIYSFTVGEAGDQAAIAYTAGGAGGSEIVEFHITDENGVAVFDWIGTVTDFSDPLPVPAFTLPHAGTYYLEVVIGNPNVWDTSTIDVTLSLEGADVLASNVLQGGTGNDTYILYAATDQVIEKPGQGTDLVRTSLSYTLGDNVENLTLTGTAAVNGTGNGLANLITGNSAANVIRGGAGGDTLIGGGAGDTLTGGAGADHFKFTDTSDSASGAEDRITDFSGKKGQGDKIDLSAIDANANTAANDAFKLVTNFNGHAGQATWHYDGQSGITSIYLDVDGDRSADMTIELSGYVDLKPSDFIF